MRPVAQAWRIATVTGTPLAVLLAGVRSDLTARQGAAREVASALAGPRSSAALLAMLPLLGAALGAAMGAHPMAVLCGQPAGRTLLCAGVVLDAVGVCWTLLLIRSANPP
jgi:tight adherence protein B